MRVPAEHARRTQHHRLVGRELRNRPCHVAVALVRAEPAVDVEGIIEAHLVESEPPVMQPHLGAAETEENTPQLARAVVATDPEVELGLSYERVTGLVGTDQHPTSLRRPTLVQTSRAGASAGRWVL